jgi:tetratricopeptide (TPR) repeat protein
LSDEPSYADAYDVMGKIFADQGDFAGAINAFRQASEITPGSVVRAQKYGILAYYTGDPAQALPALERAASLGADSPAFDHQTLLLLAMAHYKSGDAQGLKACRVRLDSAVDKLGSAPVLDARVERLQRLGQMARTLNALQDSDRVALHAGLSEVAAGLRAPGFDMEAASNLLSLIATSDAAGLALDQAVHWVRDAGLRFCVSKQITEMLVKACEAAPSHGELVRAAHAEIGELSRTALSEGLAGDHRRAVEQLLNAVERTRNGKLLEMASATLERHRERILDAEPLALRCTQLRQLCGLNSRSHLLSDESDRPAGGMALGRGRAAAPVRTISA